MLRLELARRKDSNSRPPSSMQFDLLCQILPVEWLIVRIQQVGANSRNLLSPSFIVICECAPERCWSRHASRPSTQGVNLHRNIPGGKAVSRE
jgi:hypothetical protein